MFNVPHNVSSLWKFSGKIWNIILLWTSHQDMFITFLCPTCRAHITYPQHIRKHTHKFPSSFTRADLIFGHFMYLFLFSSTSGTPEKQQPAVLFRKRLGRCKHAEKPCSLDTFLLVRPCSSLKLQKVKGQFSTQHGHTEPRVQIPAWISSGCWHRQQERTQQHGRKTQDTL